MPQGIWTGPWACSAWVGVTVLRWTWLCPDRHGFTQVDVLRPLAAISLTLPSYHPTVLPGSPADAVELGATAVLLH